MNQSLFLLDQQGLIPKDVQGLHTNVECKMPSRGSIPTGYSTGRVHGDIMVNPFYDLHCCKPNTGELSSRMLVSEFDHITMTGAMCVIMISPSPSGFMGSKVQQNTIVGERLDAHKKPSFPQGSLLPSMVSTILH
jgi:hypothetical protein